MRIHKSIPNDEGRGVKRGIDVILVLFISPLLVALVCLVGLVVLLIDGKPVFFRQIRSGRAGEPFRVVKFRTLRSGHHDPEDPQTLVTRTGRFLRRWGLDEIPQMVNVLRGEMSLVGPRPTLPEQVSRYGPFERQRLLVRPGITGWAQIQGRNALSWPERIQLDVWYVDHQSLWLDLCILIRTPYSLLTSRGVYGADGINPGFHPTPGTTASMNSIAISPAVDESP